MLGRWVSDLEEGDVLPVVEYDATPFLAREYAHAIESSWPRFHAPVDGRPQVAPPTISHIDKLRLFAAASPEGAGPVARMQIEYDARHLAEIPVGSRLSVHGHVASRRTVKGREHLVIAFEVRDADRGDVRIVGRDTSILNYVPSGDR